MALYKSWMNAIVRHSGSYSIRSKMVRWTWYDHLKMRPEITELMVHPSLSKDQWTHLKRKVEENTKGLQTISLDLMLLQLCISHVNLDLGKSYMRYLQENKTELSAAIIGKYFQLLYFNRDVITEDDKRKILELYGNLRQKYPLLDSVTAEFSLLAISLTEKWRETEELLEQVKISYDKASSVCYSAIISAAFNNGDPETGWKYFNELVKLRKKPNKDTYIAYVNYCTRTAKTIDACIDEIEKIFQFVAQHNLLPDHNVMEHIKRTFENFGWVGNFTTMSQTGICANCEYKMKPLKLSETEFEQLYKMVFDNVIVGRDVYQRTTPLEIKKFLNFVDNTKPYDVVIDGLNVGLNAKKNMNNYVAADRLSKLVRYFLDTNKVVLVLGRKHMMKWDMKLMNYVKNNAFLFLTNDISADDPYLLYATLVSGPNATFVSYDLMRQHIVHLDNSLQQTFKHWQITHQWLVDYKKGKMFLTPPVSYLPVAQKSKNCWHVPYRLSNDSLTESYEPPKEWLCLERPDSPSE